MDLPQPHTPDYFAQPEKIGKMVRAQEIGRLLAYLKGTQYDGRPDFFSGIGPRGEKVPLAERKPCIVYPLPRAACNQATRFTFGEGRFPQVAVAATDADDAPSKLGDEDAKTLTEYLGHVVELSQLKSTMRRALMVGLSQRTAVVTLCVRRGKFVVELPRPQDCWPEFLDDDPSSDVVRMTWCYVFSKQVQTGDIIKDVPHYFRRDYTAEEFIVYDDAPIVPGKPLVWVRDEARSVKHDLGFCPAVWIRNLPAPDCEDIDGTSIYEGLEDELDALNFSLSQRHRGIRYFGTPQAYEVGVSEDETPGATGRTSRAPKTSTGGAATKDPYVSAGGGPARKAAPDEVWSYQGENVEVGVLETTGIAFEVTSKHVLDVRSRLLEAMDVVLMDSSEIAGKGELSAKALAMMYAPLLALVDELRDCWWSTGLAPLLSMVLRITTALGGKGLLVPGAKKVAAICRRFLVPFEGEVIWLSPKMIPSWGSYFSPTNTEVNELVAATLAAKTGGLISEETARRNVASCFGETDMEGDFEEEPESSKPEAEIQKPAESEPEPVKPEPDEPTPPTKRNS